MIFYTTSVRNISNSQKKLARYDRKVHWSSYKVTFIPVRF